jgi:hypothetical protein
VLWKGLAKIKKLNTDLQVKRKTWDDSDGKFHNDVSVSFAAKITVSHVVRIQTWTVQYAIVKVVDLLFLKSFS